MDTLITEPLTLTTPTGDTSQRGRKVIEIQGDYVLNDFFSAEVIGLKEDGDYTQEEIEIALKNHGWNQLNDESDDQPKGPK